MSGVDSATAEASASSTRSIPKTSQNSSSKRPNIIIRFLRSVFGYRKTSLTLFVIVTLVFTVLLSLYDNSLEYSVSLPDNKLEKDILDQSWSALQSIGKYKHTYTSEGNDHVHDFLEDKIKAFVSQKAYAEFDNDLNYTNNVIVSQKYLTYDSVSYYESNNLLVRINGTNPELPAYLLSAHYDSVPTSYGITDDGMGVASLLGVLQYFTAKSSEQPERTIIFNFNNNEEFGLYGALAFTFHPWFKQIKYFLNLEGTGAGGKAFLFRATDYGVTKYFKDVRFPHGNSIFQQGFNNRLIRSETDYKVYKEKGIRGLDVAFYKPRDIYHTAGDNIRNVNIRSMWHMLSNALDYSKNLAGKIDLDGDSGDSSQDYAVYASFLNYFFAFASSQVVTAGIVLLVLIPFITLPFLSVSIYYKKNWNINFYNVIKLPFSFVISLFICNFVTFQVFEPLNQFVPNSSWYNLVVTLFAMFLFSNYIILNTFNYIFRTLKGINHDEKLIVIIETSFVYWLVLVYSTYKLSHNKIGDDHTGEYPLLLLYIVQSIAAFLGLLGWTFLRSKLFSSDDESHRPLLENSHEGYGADSDDDRVHSLASSSISLGSHYSQKPIGAITKLFGYDWSIQFLVIVPLSSVIIYNSGFLVLDGLVKSIQESLQAQEFIFKLIELFAVAWALPFLPFVFKLNRIVVIGLILVLIQGIFFTVVSSPFDEVNPLKLRFIQTIDLNFSPVSHVEVTGRDTPIVSDILKDLPSFKESGSELAVESVGDGVLVYKYESHLLPHLGVKSVEDLIDIEVLKNSSSNTDFPFGLLTGEIKISAPTNRNCKLSFNSSNTLTEIFGQSTEFKDTPVKTVFIYADLPENVTSTSDISYNSIPEGFSRDKKGNYIYKDLSGIDELQLNKLDWDKPYHVGFQWVPHVFDTDNVNAEKVKLTKLGVSVLCYWGDLGYRSEKGSIKEIVPAFEEVLHYSPNYISWANRDRGMVSVNKYVEI